MSTSEDDRGGMAGNQQSFGTTTYLHSRSGRGSSPAFLAGKKVSEQEFRRPHHNLHNGFGFVIQFCVGIRYVICQGGEFDKKEIK